MPHTRNFLSGSVVAGRLQKTNGPRLSELLCWETENYSAGGSGPFGASGGMSFASSAFLGVGGKPLNRRERERERERNPKDEVRGGPLGVFFLKKRFFATFSVAFPQDLRFLATFSKSGTFRNTKLRKQ
jgi:hypothetical protein